MTSEEIKKISMSNAMLGIEEVKTITHTVAEFKRTIEILYLIPGALLELKKDEKAFMEKYGIEGVDVEGIMQVQNEDVAEAISKLSTEEMVKKVSYQSYRYNQYNSNKMVHRDRLLDVYNVPKNEKLKKWRERQIERSKGICGEAYATNVHVSTSFELTDGCSVGCPFCGIGAKKLKEIFTYEKENIELFREVLKVMHEVIGDAAGRGAMYLENEPLDNRDYEKFLDDYLNEFGVLPQITTAVPTRDIERTKRLLKQLNETKGGTFYRFSIKSVKEAEEILNEFSCDELLRVELLPQYEDAPGFRGFAKAGRELERENKNEVKNMEDEHKGIVPSICCMSGFVVNLARKDVRFITNYPADDDHPNGEVILAKKTFTSAQELKQIVEAMIDECITNILPSDKVLKPYDYFYIANIEGEGQAIIADSGYKKPLIGPIKGFLDIAELLFERKYTKKEIAEILYKTKGIDPTSTYFGLRTLFMNGIINEYEW